MDIFFVLVTNSLRLLHLWTQSTGSNLMTGRPVYQVQSRLFVPIVHHAHHATRAPTILAAPLIHAAVSSCCPYRRKSVPTMTVACRCLSSRSASCGGNDCGGSAGFGSPYSLTLLASVEMVAVGLLHKPPSRRRALSRGTMGFHGDPDIDTPTYQEFVDFVTRRYEKASMSRRP